MMNLDSASLPTCETPAPCMRRSISGRLPISGCGRLMVFEIVSNASSESASSAIQRERLDALVSHRTGREGKEPTLSAETYQLLLHLIYEFPGGREGCISELRDTRQGGGRRQTRLRRSLRPLENSMPYQFRLHPSTRSGCLDSRQYRSCLGRADGRQTLLLLVSIFSRNLRLQQHSSGRVFRLDQDLRFIL
jgi:hypothetical protein